MGRKSKFSDSIEITKETRIEREGPISPITPRVVDFIEQRLAGVSLDTQGDAEKRPDYVCLRGLLRVEIKTLVESPEERVENFLRPILNDPRNPNFVGTVNAWKYLGKIDDTEELRRRLIDRLGRNIRTQIKKANDQLKSFTLGSNRKNFINVVLLINEDHVEHDPNSMAHIINKILEEKNGEEIRNSHIDFVVFFSERHALSVDDRVGFCFLIIEGYGTSVPEWKNSVIDLMARRWADWNGSLFIQSNEDVTADFVNVDHVPETMPRHELWRLEYRRDPYMRNWTEHKMQSYFDAHMLVSMLASLKDSPATFASGDVSRIMRLFTHWMEEANSRAFIPSRETSYEDAIKAFKDFFPEYGQYEKWLR